MAATTAIVLTLSTLLSTPAGAPATAPTPAPMRVTSPRLDLAPSPSPRRIAKAKRLTQGQRRSARSVVAIGSVVLGVFYVAGTLVAAQTMDEVHEDGHVDVAERDPLRISALMFVPGIGPLTAAPLAKDVGEGLGIAGFGLMQAMGAACLVSGLVTLARDRRARRLELGAAPASGGGTLSLRGRF